MTEQTSARKDGSAAIIAIYAVVALLLLGAGVWQFVSLL